MDKNEFLDLLENPANVSPNQISALERIIMEAPYFQATRAIRLKALKEQESFSYNSALKKTAAYTTDREVLFDFITSKEFNQNSVAREINAQNLKINEIEVIDAREVSGRLSIAIDDAIKMKQSESERVMDPGLFQQPKKSSEEISEEKSATEADLNLGKPLEFNPSEAHSFTEWLKLTSAKPIEREDKKEEPQKEKFRLIEEFISKNPRLKPGDTATKGNLAEQNKIAPEALMTETLARVYLEQKNYKKAIQAYKILILKNPEKSGFFADQIRAIEKIQDTNTNSE
jgi:hypothetical protein